MAFATIKDMEFTGKNVVLTGGSNGIGAAFARALAAEGATVVSLDLAAPAERSKGVTHVRCDVSARDDVRTALAKAGGRIDLLVLNAGVIRRGPVLSHTEEEFDILFGVNAKGAWLVLKEGLPLLSPEGAVLYVSSYRAGQDVDDPGLYAASKAAGEHIVRCAGTNARVKIARLGPVDTRMARYGVEGDALKRKEPLMREPDDIAAMLLELAGGAHSALSYDPGKDAYAFS